MSRRGSGRTPSPYLAAARRASIDADKTALSVARSKLFLSVQSESIANQIVRRDIEPLFSANFFDKYFDMIVLPNCHPQFYHGWIDEIKELMAHNPSLYYSMLACSATQVHAYSGTAQLLGLALEYYGQGMRHVSRLLEVDSVANHNGLLMSIILLYLHGCLGQATFGDVPRHLDAAMSLVRLRFFDSRGAIQHTFDRIALESVLYQMFLTAAGTWSACPPDSTHVDAEFWSTAQLLLENSNLFPDDSPAVNSPVLGIPISLFRLVLSAKQLYHRSDRLDVEELGNLQAEIADWEALVLQNGEADYAASQSNLSHYQLYKDAAYLYILIASLLIDQAASAALEGASYQISSAGESWQAVRMLEILRRQQGNREWSKCFLSNWPLYATGFFMHTPDTQALVRQELLRRIEVTGFLQASRFLNELELIWMERGPIGTSTVQRSSDTHAASSDATRVDQRLGVENAW